MKILLLGYGKMGKTIEAIALERGHQVIEKIDLDNRTALEQYNGSNVDVAIEFSQPDAAFENIGYCIKNGIPVVSGTTGWLDKKEQIHELCRSHDGTFFYASNFSIGVNLFFRLNEQLAGMMEAFDDYNISMEEIHHTEKKDEPSGTAISLAEGIMAHNRNKESWALNQTDSKNIIPIVSKRVGEVPGTHIVTYASLVDSIEIKHTAHSRQGFARGAMQVAEWVPGKKGVLGMTDFLKI